MTTELISGKVFKSESREIDLHITSIIPYPQIKKRINRAAHVSIGSNTKTATERDTVARAAMIIQGKAKATDFNLLNKYDLRHYQLL